VVESKDALRTYATTIDAPQALVWEYLTAPALRPMWQQAVEAVLPQAGPAGRRGIGTVNHCMHGKDVIVEQVVDWEPVDHVTYGSLLPVPGAPKLLNTYELSDLGDGRTRLELRFARPRTKKDRAMAEDLVLTLDTVLQGDIEALGALASAAARAVSGAVLPEEPDLPASRNRMISEARAAPTQRA
jgi:uncharacterized protein YndB with AHSA1/START domain